MRTHDDAEMKFGSKHSFHVPRHSMEIWETKCADCPQSACSFGQGVFGSPSQTSLCAKPYSCIARLPNSSHFCPLCFSERCPSTTSPSSAGTTCRPARRLRRAVAAIAAVHSLFTFFLTSGRVRKKRILAVPHALRAECNLEFVWPALLNNNLSLALHVPIEVDTDSSPNRLFYLQLA